MKLYKCCTCGDSKPLTEEHWYTNQIERGTLKPNSRGLGRCKPCARTSTAKRQDYIKQAGFSRSMKNHTKKRKTGTLYVIAPENNQEHPYKIGITVGSDISKRLTALQTSHWLTLKVYYKSPLIYDVHKAEKMFHDRYKDKKVKGEWFNITNSDLKDIINECEKI